MFKSIVVFAAIAATLAAADFCQHCVLPGYVSGPGAGPCPHRTTCEVAQGGTHCVKLQPLGWSCSNECEECQEPYVCQNGACRAADVRCGHSCSYNGEGQCEAGSYCNGKKCINVNNAGLDKECNDCKACDYGLTCGYQGKCIKH